MESQDQAAQEPGPAEEAAEALPAEALPAEAQLELPVELPTPKPRTVRIRKPRPASQVVVPEINERFWANLLRTQRAAEHATRLQRISDFQLM